MEKAKKDFKNMANDHTHGSMVERMQPKPAGTTATSVDGGSGMLCSDGRSGDFGNPQPHIGRNQFFYGDGSRRDEWNVGPVS